MDKSVISKIKESFINYFGNNQISEIENLFDDITIILWKNDNGKITYTFDDKENQYSNSLKKYLKNNWNNIVKEELDGFCLSNTKSPTIFVNSASDTLIAILMHEILHAFLNDKLKRTRLVEHDFFVELIIEYINHEILTMYNSKVNQINIQDNTYLQLDKLLGFPIKKLYQQLEDIIKNDIVNINQIVNIFERVTISTYFQDLLDKVYSSDRKKSFKEQYNECISEYSIELEKTVENIIGNYLDYQNKLHR